MSGHKNWVSKRTCVYNIGYHIVWSTKYRRNVLSGAVEKRLKELFQEIAIDFGFEVSEFEVMPDHCHLFVTCHPKYSPSDIVKQLKGITAR
ncbi:MAG: IS200/IS605 family transposase, partial [Bacteroidota bacterium]